MIDVETLLGDLPAPDLGSREAVRSRAATVLRPAGALARLDEIAVWLAGWQRTAHPAVEHPVAIVFAADHGVAAAGVSAYPADVTKAMVAALEAEVATATAMARAIGATCEVVDVGVGDPTGDIRVEAAMSPGRFDASLVAGRDAVTRAADAGADLLVLGEMGIGNTTPAAAVCSALFGGPAARWTGRGTGVDDEAYARKVDVVDVASTRARDLPPLDVLRQVGGAELAAIAGAAIEARRRSLPVVLDGFVVGASLASLHVAAPGVLDHCVAGHRSAEPGHALLLEGLGTRPLIDLDLRLGEGSGALAAVPLIRLAAVAVTDVATFEEWGLV